MDPKILFFLVSFFSVCVSWIVLKAPEERRKTMIESLVNYEWRVHHDIRY